MKKVKYWKIGLLFLLGIVVGAVANVANHKFNVIEGLRNFESYLIMNGYYYFIWIALLFMVVCFGLYFVGKKQYITSIENDLDDEDKLLNLALILSMIGMVISIMFFMIITSNHDIDGTRLLVSVGLLIDVIVLLVSMQSAIIQLIKKYDPMKKGDPIDLNFDKQWLEGLDEYEKSRTYEAGFKGYKAMLSTTFILLIISSMYTSVVKSIFPIVVCGVIMISGIIAYGIESFKS